MIDFIFCIIYRVNFNKLYIYILEIYNVEKNFVVELLKENRLKLLDLYILFFCIELKVRILRFFLV